MDDLGGRERHGDGPSKLAPRPGVMMLVEFIDNEGSKMGCYPSAS